jgi:acetolactate synthase-1/3 small subunit
MVVKQKKEESKSVYGEGPGVQCIERHTLSVLVDNEPGVLARVIGLFSGRGYNIDSLTVAEVSQELNQSRMTIVVTGTPEVIEQVINLLGRLVPVHKVTDLTVLGPHIERDLVLIKIAGSKDNLLKAYDVANEYGAIAVDKTDESYVFEYVDTPEKLDEFLAKVTPLGMKNISRTGCAAISRGKDKF